MISHLESGRIVLALTTVASSTEAEQLVRRLLEARLIACGTLLPAARSLYHWEGEITDEAEVVVLLKTVADRLDAIGAAFQTFHPYDEPELMVFPTHAGLEGYLTWVREEADGIAGASHSAASSDDSDEYDDDDDDDFDDDTDDDDDEFDDEDVEDVEAP